MWDFIQALCFIVGAFVLLFWVGLLFFIGVWEFSAWRKAKRFEREHDAALMDGLETWRRDLD